MKSLTNSDQPIRCWVKAEIDGCWYERWYVERLKACVEGIDHTEVPTDTKHMSKWRYTIFIDPYAPMSTRLIKCLALLKWRWIKQHWNHEATYGNNIYRLVDAYPALIDLPSHCSYCAAYKCEECPLNDGCCSGVDTWYETGSTDNIIKQIMEVVT